ncbi:MAG: ATP-sensitive inward rectifier potassium channel 10 [Telmatospirillum sp.]|nr:ATP-sensitive inward rectifier potassium channel 10 [Telmatospirillum sp.]
MERSDPVPRMLHPDGGVAVLRPNGRHPFTGDLYHWLLTSRRGIFLTVLLAGYLGVNTLFALGYLGCGDGIDNMRPGSFEDAFFFSVQTMATIGYGRMVPISTAANLLVTLEAGVGLMGVAMTAALMFARFTRPTAGVRFSRDMVVSDVDGVPTLMIRLANQRNDLINEARVHLIMLRHDRTAEGEDVRRLLDLDLVRSFNPAFALSWTVMHRIDGQSPLKGLGCQDLGRIRAEFMVLLSGHHEGFRQAVHARRAYSARDIVWGARFADIFRDLPDGRRVLDDGPFDDTVEARISASS